MIRFSIRRPVAVSMAYLTATLLGVAAWRNIPVELLPETDLPRLSVTANWPGASPEATEAFVTAPLEAAIQQVRGVEKISSESSDQNGTGRAVINIEFARNTDMDFARLELSERIASLEGDMPPGVQAPYVTPYVPPEFSRQNTTFLSYILTGPYTVEALRQWADDELYPALREIEGIATVSVDGGRRRVLEVELDERKAQALRLNPAVVASRIRELDLVQTAGAVEEGGLQRSVVLRMRPDTATELLSMILEAGSGRLVRLGDVATVRDTYEEPTSLFRIDGNPAVNVTLRREIGSNSLDVADRAKAAVDSVARALPPGGRLILDRDMSKDIRAQFTDLRTRATFSAVVIFFVLLIFLRSLRSAVIVFATIGFSLMIALNFVYFAGFSLNILTLMGMAMGFGLIVDNAIVVLENIYRRRREGEAAESAAEGGARDVVLAIIVATLTTVVVFIPFVYLQGELRLYYLPLAIVVGLSLIASLLVSFSFIPALASRALVLAKKVAPGALGDAPPRDPFYVRWYAGAIRGTLRFPWLVCVVAIAMFAGSWYLFDKYVARGRLWSGFGGQASYIDIFIRLPQGESLQRANELASFFEEKLKLMPELERYTTNVFSNASARVHITFPKEIEATLIPLAIYDQLAAYSYQFGGADVRVTGVGRAFYGGGTSPPNYSIRIRGYNYKEAERIAEGLADRLTRYSRIRDVDINSAGRFFGRNKATEVVVRIDRQRLGMHELTVEHVLGFVRAATNDRPAGGAIRIGGEEVQLSVKYADFEKVQLRDLENLSIPTPNGGSVRLGTVATVEERFLPGTITREDQQYQRIVSYEFRGPVKLGDRTRDAVIASTAVPEGYEIIGREQFSFTTEDQQQIRLVLAISLVLVFMVCAALFESIRQPLCVLLTVPMALIGVFMLFFYVEATFTREAYIGVIMMGGIVVNNSILLIDRINQLRREHGVPLVDAIVRGAIQRVRPILMTSASTVFGLLPLVLFSEYADQNIWNALGYALIGGLTSSTFLVLTVTPALYLLFERRAERKRLAVRERQRGSEAVVGGSAVPAPAV